MRRMGELCARTELGPWWLRCGPGCALGGWGGIFGIELQQPGQHIGLFDRGAFALEHIVAVAAKPFVHLGGVRKALGVERRREGRDGLARAGMAGGRGGRIAMARGARPFTPMATGEKNAAALGVDRLAGNIAPALHLRGGGGVASVGGRQGKGQRQQRGHAGERGGVWGVHAAMVRGGHEEWLKATLNKPSKISAQTWMTQFFGLLCLSRGPFGQFAGR